MPGAANEFMPLSESIRQRLSLYDRFIVAYPRSGSRWLRLLLADVLNQAHGYDPRALYDNQLACELSQPPPRPTCLLMKQVMPCIHYAPETAPAGLSPVYRSHSLADLITLPRAKVVYTFRQPVAALCSYYFFTKERNDSAAEQTIDEFCYSRAPEWANHLASALQFRDAYPDRILLLCYSATAPFTAAQLQATSVFLGIPCTNALARRAIANFQDFLGKLNRNNLLCQRGTDRYSSRLLTRETTRMIDVLTRRLFKHAVRQARCPSSPLSTRDCPGKVAVEMAAELAWVAVASLNPMPDGVRLACSPVNDHPIDGTSLGTPRDVLPAVPNQCPALAWPWCPISCGTSTVSVVVPTLPA